MLSPPITNEHLKGKVFYPGGCTGSILLIEEANPKYVPYLPRVDAVIIEKAGLISHLAILCREVGIPMIQISNATRYLKCGDIVLINFINLELIKI